MTDKVLTYYAAPIARRDDGAIVLDEAVECPTPDVAVRRARQMSLSGYNVGAIAFSRYDRQP
jgi:hypothetical protein